MGGMHAMQVTPGSRTGQPRSKIINPQSSILSPSSNHTDFADLSASVMLGYQLCIIFNMPLGALQLSSSSSSASASAARYPPSTRCQVHNSRLRLGTALPQPHSTRLGHMPRYLGWSDNSAKQYINSMPPVMCSRMLWPW